MSCKSDGHESRAILGNSYNSISLLHLLTVTSSTSKTERASMQVLVAGLVFFKGSVLSKGSTQTS